MGNDAWAICKWYSANSSTCKHEVNCWACLSRYREMMQLPIIWTVWRARSVLLTVVQALVACRLAFIYISEERQGHSLDGSSVLPFDMVKAELFDPSRKKHVATSKTVQKMVFEMASCFWKEWRDPKKTTSDYLTSSEGKFSWGYTTEDEHNALIGKSATNDSAKIHFVMLTQQMQQFGRILGIHAAAVG